MSSGSQGRWREEEGAMAERERASSGSQGRWREEEGGARSAMEGGNLEGNIQIPPGFTVRRVEQGFHGEEEQETQGRGRGRYRKEMGATNLSWEMDRAAAAMEKGLCLEEERLNQEFGRPIVETALSLGPTQQVPSAHQEIPAQSLNQAGLFLSADYQHTQELGEEGAGRKQKKRKGMGLVGGDRPRAELGEEEAFQFGPAGGFEVGGLGDGTKKKNLKVKSLNPNTSKGNQHEINQEGRGKKNKAAVVRQKPPLQE
ncbi:unnamed protein product [Linum trigynum]|uniref:Uncharacterized protein n=1 Tax=Linum trigynum TaxID=586398 RepID=A0AAV2GF99_9ROSI